MLNKLKTILNAYSDKELKEIELWVNSSNMVKTIIFDGLSIDLITEDAEIKVNDKIV